MGNNLLGGLGGLGGGLSDALGGLVGGLAKSGIVPQDDPEVKIFNAQQEIADLQKQEAQLLSEVGRKVMDSEAASVYPQEAGKLKLIRSNIAEAQQTLSTMQSEQQAQQQQAQQEENARTCPQCGQVNPEGVNFCQECGTKLGAPQKAFCTDCGAENAPGTKFCGECGARIGD
jgi:formate dehydrogenase maturation protein FdhE